MSAPCSPGSDPDPPYNPSFSPLPCFRLGFLPVDPPGDPRILTPVLSTTRHTSPGYDTLPLRVARHLSPLAPPVFVFHHGVDLSATHPSFPRATPRILVSSPLFRPPFLWVACRLSTPAPPCFVSHPEVALGGSSRASVPSFVSYLTQPFPTSIAVRTTHVWELAPGSRGKTRHQIWATLPHFGAFLSWSKGQFPLTRLVTALSRANGVLLVAHTKVGNLYFRQVSCRASTELLLENTSYHVIS